MYEDKEPEVTPPRGVWVFWAVLATFGFIALVGRLLQDEKYDYLQTVVLALTLLAILWYTYETRKMQQAVRRQVDVGVRQTNVSILPIFVVYIDRVHTIVGPKDGHSRPCVEVENIGNGDALNVQIDTIDIEFENDLVYETWPEPKIIFDSVVSVARNTTVIIEYYPLYRKGDELVTDDRWNWINNLKPNHAFKDYEMKIRFMDILGNRYVQVVHAGKSGCWPGAVLPDMSERKLPSHLPRLNDFTESPLKYR